MELPIKTIDKIYNYIKNKITDYYWRNNTSRTHIH